MQEVLSRLVYPEWYVLLGFFALFGIDLLTGILKAKSRGEATTSAGLRRTSIKGATYFSLATSVLVIMNITTIASGNKGVLWVFGFSINGLIVGLCWIELKSIFENLIAVNKEPDGSPNDVARKYLIPIHNRLIFKLSNDYKEND